jgi:flagellar protein FlgJ
MIKIDSSMALAQFNVNQARAELNRNQETTNDKLLKEQTDNFEALLIKQLLDESLKHENGLFPKQAGSEIYQSMFNDAVSKEVSGGFGFSKMLFDFLKENPSS